MTDLGQLRATIGIAALIVIQGCGGGSGASAAPTVVPPTAAQPTATAVPTEPPAIVLEDAGVDVALAAGRYTSRVFRPVVELELPAGWWRHNATQAEAVGVGSTTTDIIFSIRHVDFAQCGTTLLEHPAAAAVAQLLASTTQLAPAASTGPAIGSVPASFFELPGTGPGGNGDIDPANGCIFSTGAAAYPAESGWTILTSADAARLAFLDVDGATLIVLAWSPTAELAAVRSETQALFDGLRFPS